MNFTKMEGCGNDYIYINCLENEILHPEEFSKWVSDEHFGIGSDGLVLICPSQTADFKMRIFNADGSEAKMCGNATRCVGKYVYEKGLTNKTTVRIETLSGIKILNLTVHNNQVTDVTVNMGKAVLKPREIPINADGENYVSQNIEIDNAIYQITCVSMGNPHAVVFMEDVANLDIASVGPLFENHQVFPNRTNTEFVEVVDRTHVNMRVWERGTGETLACGTGCCATVVAGVLNGLTEEKVTVRVLGGEIEIQWDREENLVYMTGPAATVFEGEFPWDGN